MTDLRRLSFWFDSMPGPFEPRSSLPGPTEADVCIVGAGYTGLWTAYYLARADPSLRVVVLEAQTAGFGASGRNGGWCSALFPAPLARVARRAGRDAALALQRALHDTVDEVGSVAATERIDCHFTKGGTVTLARTPVQVERARGEVAEARSWGLGPEHLRWLGRDEAAERLGATRVLGGTFTPHCAALHPARLVRGLADAVVRQGVEVFEGTPVTRIAPGRVSTPYGDVTARHVVRATEGWTARLPGARRALAPVYSLMVATEPLPDEVWNEIGLRDRETFTDHRHLIVYGQRTVDGRLAFGGRGAPYHFGSGVRPEHDHEPAVFAALHDVLVEMFPAVRDAAVTHTWGGPLGIPRDWFPSVGLDPVSGMGWAGGYVGDGVAASNLAGRTMADLVTGRDTRLTRLPWVNHRSRQWEPEPLRWLGINAALRVMTSADAEEARTGRPSRRAALVGRLTGH